MRQMLERAMYAPSRKVQSIARVRALSSAEGAGTIEAGSKMAGCSQVIWRNVSQREAMSRQRPQQARGKRIETSDATARKGLLHASVGNLLPCYASRREDYKIPRRGCCQDCRCRRAEDGACRAALNYLLFVKSTSPSVHHQVNLGMLFDASLIVTSVIVRR